MYLYVPECIYDASNFYGERQELEMRAAGVLAVVSCWTKRCVKEINKQKSRFYVDRYQELRQTALAIIVWASVPRFLCVEATLICFTSTWCDSWHADQRT